MHTSKFVYFLLLAAVSQAYAGAGQTNAGVTTTVPTDSTAATQDVQSQSSNFVQQNQALAGSNGVTGTAVASGAVTPGAATQGQPGGAIDANGRPISTPSNDAKAADQKPAAPPAPPPEYVSNIKKVDHSAAVVPVATPASATADTKPAGTKPADTSKEGPTAALDTGVVTAPGAQRQAAAPQKVAPRPAAAAPERTGAEHVTAGAGSSGGSGAPPDSYAFYIGLIIAGALLAFAAAMFLRTEKGGAR